MTRWPPPVYEIQVEFRAPLSFVYGWCTDYRPGDDRLAGERWERRIISRSSRRVLYEDLWWSPDGWSWRRYDVSLRPPNRWVARSIGNVRDARIDYHLTTLPDGRTRLDLRMHRRPGPRQSRQPSKKVLEKELVRLWRNYSRALEADYRRSGSKGLGVAAKGRKRR
jgi:hypothetical protein